MKVPLLDLKAQLKTIEKEVKDAVNEVIDSTRYIMGPKVAELEGRIAECVGAKYATGVSSGTVLANELQRIAQKNGKNLSFVKAHELAIMQLNIFSRDKPVHLNTPQAGKEYPQSPPARQVHHGA